MRLVAGRVQTYAWGDPQSIPAILGIPADGRPWAEWWLGTHPGAPSTVDGRPLAEVAGELPYLLKLLAAAEPLSLQTHPSTAQAQAGFDREERGGIALDDSRRIYKDRSAKPELLCALTEFDALCGFASMEHSLALLAAVGAADMAAELDDHGLAAVVHGLYRRTIELDPVVEACQASGHVAARLVAELADRYPDDPSVAVTLLLNRVRLAPGQAIYLGPGNLHAYLRGTGVEVMAASDNVVRGGMTPKHIDVGELLDVLDITPLADPVVSAVRDGGGWRYPTPGAPFVLRRYEDGGIVTAEGPELLLCVAGDAGVLHRGECGYLEPGETVELAGGATVFRVGPS
jgi:mannose-6-phosphate isomerase